MAQHIALGLLSQKQNHGEVSPSKQMRKLKIQLADRTFQLKKMQQDFAQQKAHILMQFTQQKNSLQSTIRQLKTKLSEQNQHWVNKINEIRFAGEQLIEQNNKHWIARVQEQVTQKVQQIKLKYESQVTQLKKNVSKLNQSLKQKQKSFQKRLKCVKQTYNVQILELKQSKQAQIQQIKKKMSRDQQIKINAVMHIKNGQQKQHSNTKSLLLRRQRQYNETIKKSQQRIFQLNQQIWSLKNKVQHLSERNNQQNQQITKLQQIKVSTVQITSRQYEQKLEKSQEEWKKNLQSLNQKWKSEYKKVQQAYQKLSNAFAQKQKLWQDRGSKVLKLYQMRQAREEDVKLIQHLQVQLIKKQFELERQKQELKTCKLQLDNMDDIYKRIFSSVKKNNRQSHSFQLKKMRLPGIMNKSTHPVKGEFY